MNSDAGEVDAGFREGEWMILSEPNLQSVSDPLVAEGRSHDDDQFVKQGRLVCWIPSRAAS